MLKSTVSDAPAAATSPTSLMTSLSITTNLHTDNSSPSKPTSSTVPVSTSPSCAYLSCDLPPEIWERILLFLAWRDLRNMTQLAEKFWILARPLLWRDPLLKNPLNMDALKMLLQLGVPIRVLRTSHVYKMIRLEDELAGSPDREQATQVFVEFVRSNFSLTSFIIDNVKRMTLHSLECLFQLPVTSVTMRCLPFNESLQNCIQTIIKPRFSCSTDDDADEQLRTSPSLTICGFSHARLTLDDWRQLVEGGARIVEITADFPRRIMLDLEQYNQIIGSILPPPRYILDGYSLLPAFLRPFTKIRISQLYVRLFNPYRQLEEYICALAKRNQRPELVFTKNTPVRFTPKDLRLLFKNYPVASLHTGALKLTQQTMDQFVNLIIGKHKEDPIPELVIVMGEGSHFTERHLRKLANFGLIVTLEEGSKAVSNK